MVEFRILGPVEVVGEDGSVDLGGPLEKALLARLLLDAGRVVALDRLIDDLWEGEPPGSANVSIRVRVSRLRKALASAGSATTIATKQPGYELDLAESETLDVASFDHLHASGRAALQSGDPASAVRDIEEALALWRGPALAGIGEAPFARAEGTRLEEARLAAVEDRIEAGLAAGHHAEHAVELETLVKQHPLRERLWGQRMKALYRSGRQADALSAFQDLRKILSQELGLDPSPEIAKLESQILAQAPEIALRAIQRAPESGLPTGVVTFLLTDIEGSTELWEAHPVGMAEVLEQHDRLVEDLITSRAGHLIKSKGEGDATLSVFRRATDAVAAALDLRHAVENKPWRDEIQLRVRMAIHTGEAHERDGDYFGPAVNRAARVRSLAAGGQILLSQVAVELVRDALPNGSSLTDLGERALRGMARAEHVFELVPEGEESLAEPAHAAPPSRPPIPDAVLPPPGTQFVGREMELERLRASLKQVGDGGLRTVFAAGEPGIGKTRMCAEFARMAYEDGAVVLYGRCDEEPLVPYQPFVEALRRWAVALTPEERSSVPRTDYLAPLITELAANAKSPPVEDPEVARYKFFEAVASALEHAALAGPVLLIVDDLHWADRPTLQLLQHVLRTRAASPILVLGTYRETDLARTRPLAESLSDFRRERAFERLALPGLAEEEILALLERTASHEIGAPGRELARALSETTDGNPFFIEQILGNLVETGRLVLREGRWVLEARVEELGIPEGVIEAIGRRLSRLSEDCNKVLAAASVIGRDFEVDVLTRVVERDPDDVLAAIEEALQVGLVREVQTRGRSSCTFSHALVQQALYEELSLARKQRLHLKAAAAIEAVHGSDLEPHVTTLARHLREAGAAADPAKTVDYSVRALEAAARVFAFEEGIAHGESALELADEYGMKGPQEARLHERLGDIHYVAGLEYEKSFSHYEAALAGYEATDEPGKVARVHIKLGRGLATFVDISDINRSFEHLEAAAAMLGPNPDRRMEGPLALGFAAASGYGADFRSCSEYAERALEIAEEQGSEAMQSSAMGFQGWVLTETGRLDEGLARLDEAWAIADRLDNVLAGFATAWIACAGYEVDPREHAKLALLELKRPRQAQAANARQSLARTICGALMMAGEIDQAREQLEAIQKTIAFGANRIGAIGPGLMYLADSLEDEEQASIGFIADLKARGHEWIAERAKPLYQGIVRHKLGRIDQARETFITALEAAKDTANVSEVATRLRLGVLEANEGNIGLASDHLARAEAVMDKGNGWRGFHGLADIGRASLLVAGNKIEEAGQAFETSIEIFERHHLPFEAADAFHLWGRALSASDPKRALEKFDAALEIYTTRGAGKAWPDHVKKDRDRIPFVWK
jgi:DNA-binding SARP family transcriptional activator